jgi:hypothetical protein
MNNTEHLKKQLIDALTKSLGIVTTACKEVGISRTTFYQYMKDDKEFKEEIESIEDIALDFAESKLHKLIQDGIPAATIFYLKTKGKKRGYIEKQQLEHSGSIEPITGVNIVDDN